MTDRLVCWKCGASITDLPLPMSRTAECSICRVDLHVCRMCEFYDIRVAMNCREPIAADVRDKERANFCEYFAAKAGAYNGYAGDATQAARRQLESLFGGDPGGTRRDNGKTVSRSEADVAREKLEQLFSSGVKGDI